MTRQWRNPLILLVVASLITGCPPGQTGVPGNGDPGGEPSADALPDFSVPDVNANSARSSEAISPRDYLGQVSAWYFGHSTWGYCQSQFGFLNQMQSELAAESTTRPIQILGVNGVGLESGNNGMTSGRVLPWLQPEPDEDVWVLWAVEYRDVFIVGPDNEHIGTYNLTVHDLADPANYAALRDQLMQAANE